MENTLCIVDAVMPWVYSWTLAALTAMVTIQCRANSGSDICNCPYTLHTHKHTSCHTHTCISRKHTHTHIHHYPVCKAAASMASCCHSVFSVLEVSWAWPTCCYQPDWSNTPTAAPRRLEQHANTEFTWALVTFYSTVNRRACRQEHAQGAVLQKLTSPAGMAPDVQAWGCCTMGF